MTTKSILDTTELLQEWLKAKQTEKSFALSNYIKNNLILYRGQTQTNKAIQKYESILTALLIDTCAYLVCKQFDIKITFDVKNKQVIFTNLQNIDKNITIKQKLYYNTYLECSFGVSEEEIKDAEEKENAEKMQSLQEMQSLYDALGIPAELANLS